MNVWGYFIIIIIWPFVSECESNVNGHIAPRRGGHIHKTLTLVNCFVGCAGAQHRSHVKALARIHSRLECAHCFTNMKWRGVLLDAPLKPSHVKCRPLLCWAPTAMAIRMSVVLLRFPVRLIPAWFAVVSLHTNRLKRHATDYRSHMHNNYCFIAAFSMYEVRIQQFFAGQVNFILMISFILNSAAG